MKLPSHVWKQLKSISVEELISALKRDGWQRDITLGAVLVYRHSDGRRVTIHYHPKKTFGPKLLKALLEDTEWTQKDMKRLKLIK